MSLTSRKFGLLIALLMAVFLVGDAHGRFTARAELRQPAASQPADESQATEELRAMFIHADRISLRDPDTLAMRDDVTAGIRHYLDADSCRYFLAGDYSAEDWAVNIALSIDGLPLVQGGAP